MTLLMSAPASTQDLRETLRFLNSAKSTSMEDLRLSNVSP